MGKAHNIVRHPDMPPAAFEDLWNTLMGASRGAAGEEPLQERRFLLGGRPTSTRSPRTGEITGYVSMRSRPTREQVEWAENTYRLVREGRANHLRIKECRVESAGCADCWQARLAERQGAADAGDGGADVHRDRPVVHRYLSTWMSTARNVFDAGRDGELYMARLIVRPLREAVRVANAITAGDLGVEVENGRRDEYGDLLYALNIMRGTLQGIVADVVCKASAFNHTASGIAAGNDSLSQRTEQQASSLEETASNT